MYVLSAAAQEGILCEWQFPNRKISRTRFPLYLHLEIYIQYIYKIHFAAKLPSSDFLNHFWGHADFSKPFLVVCLFVPYMSASLDLKTR